MDLYADTTISQFTKIRTPRRCKNWVDELWKLTRFVTFESADEGVDISELQAHNCITPEQWSGLLCSEYHTGK